MAPDLVRRVFNAVAPDVLWCGDMTEIVTGEGMVQSMGRVGSALDNAVAESFDSVLKVEFVHRHTFAIRAETRIRIATWITDFYNTRRRHSKAGGLPPVEFERVTREACEARQARYGQHEAAPAA